MANVVWPDSLCPRTFSLRLIADTRSSGSVYGGSEIVNDLEDDTWAVTMEIDSRSGETGDALGALVNYLQGGIHTAEFGHFARPLPIGGVLNTTLALDAAKGSSSVLITTPTGKVVKIGDFFSVSGLLLQCSESIAVTGTLARVSLVNRLRKALVAGAPVNFDNPKIKWRLDSASEVGNLVGYTSPVTLSFTEDI